MRWRYRSFVAPPRPVRVSADDIDTIAVLRQAIARHDAMKRSNPAYASTTLQMQDVGLLGEHAVSHWLRRHAAHVVTIADTAEARRGGTGDVAIIGDPSPPGTETQHHGKVTFEVKTSRYRSWRRYERTLDAAQLARSTADAYIWCVVSNDWPTESVLLMGWLPTETLRERDARTATREHDRPHWRITVPMRPMADLPHWWQAQSVMTR